MTGDKLLQASGQQQYFKYVKMMLDDVFISLANHIQKKIVGLNISHNTTLHQTIANAPLISF